MIKRTSKSLAAALLITAASIVSAKASDREPPVLGAQGTKKLSEIVSKLSETVSKKVLSLGDFELLDDRTQTTKAKTSEDGGSLSNVDGKNLSNVDGKENNTVPTEIGALKENFQKPDKDVSTILNMKLEGFQSEILQNTVKELEDLKKTVEELSFRIQELNGRIMKNQAPIKLLRVIK